MHPYEMKSKMKERGHDEVIKIKGGSIYDTVERLEQDGFIKSQETSREGRRPERTVYAITEIGREETKGWLRELLSEPAHEYPQFAAALAFMGGLTKEDVVHLLQVRAATLLIVGGNDVQVIELNRVALAVLRCEKELVIVPGATHLFEEPGTLDKVASLAREWFQHHLISEGPRMARARR